MIIEEKTLGNRYQIKTGDCLKVLKSMDENSVDSLVTDPPAGIAFMGKEWDKDRGGRDEWIAWMRDVMKEAMRVMKPGAHGLVWALPRTSHWTAMALEDAGFEVRDCVYHVFGSGFPKSLAIDKAIDKMNGDERPIVGMRKETGPDFADSQFREQGSMMHTKSLAPRKKIAITSAASAASAAWAGWGTALKPAVECWWLVRKPISEKTVASNVLKWGTGGLNIDASRIGTAADLNPNDYDDTKRSAPKFSGIMNGGKEGQYRARTGAVPSGRFPSHLVLSHADTCTDDACDMFECPIAIMDGQSGNLHPGGQKSCGSKNANSTFGIGIGIERKAVFKDSGGASRFFYCAKPSKRERNAGCDGLPEKLNDFQRESSGLSTTTIDGVRQKGNCGRPNSNFHPTVKPIKLMSYLIRMITPPNGTVLDPFLGSGTTGVAALREGFRFIGIEQEPEYVNISKARLEHAVSEARP